MTTAQGWPESFEPRGPMNLRCTAKLASSSRRALRSRELSRKTGVPRALLRTSTRPPHPSRANSPAVDFVCPQWHQPFQLKGLKGWNQKKIPDAGYESMLNAIRTDRTPNLLIMQYSTDWLVRNLLCSESLFFGAHNRKADSARSADAARRVDRVEQPPPPPATGRENCCRAGRVARRSRRSPKRIL